MPMSRARKAKAALATIVALASLIVVASAGAAAWQGPFTISEPQVNTGDRPVVSAGALGDAAAGWWDATNARLILARRRAGGAWTGSANLAASAGPQFVFSGVDGAGNVTAAFSIANVATLAIWPAGASAPTTAPLMVTGGLTVDDLAVDAAGDAVLSGSSGADLVVAYRHGFGGTFVQHRFVAANSSNSRVAINGAGMAIVIYRDNATGLFASTRTAASDWGAVPEQVTAQAVQDIVPTVGLDGGGNAWAAFTYLNAGVAVVRTALQPPGGGWQESGDLSVTTAGFAATQVQIAVNASGRSLLAWKQEGNLASDANIVARYGSTGTGLWGPIETVNDAGADTPVAAISDDGTGAVTWERATSSGNTGQARIRATGANGTWGDIHNLNQLHTANFSQPWIATDGHDFVTATAPNDGTLQPVLISAYDRTPPAIAPIAVAGTMLAGDPLSLTVTAKDVWSTVGVPTWTFSDGGTASGASVAHVFGTAGTYTAHVAVSDGSANSAGADVTVTVAAAQSTLTAAKFSAKWKRSKVRGTLVVAGTAPRAGTYAIDLTRGKKNVDHLSLNLPAGPFTHTYKLSSKFLPGIYGVALTPAVPASVVTPASASARLAAPPEGVVDVAFLSGARNGTAARTLTGASTIWASFHFAAKPKGRLTLTWYRIGKKRVRLGSTSKDSATKIVSYIRSRTTFKGTYRAVLSRKGVVIAQASVKAK